jgi:peptidoglycan/LPS O-acetylase OafA/YrhL
MQQLFNETYESLDGLRGLAILFVLYSHLAFFGNFWLWNNNVLFAAGGVELFFVLSAFLLSTQYLGRPAKAFDLGAWLTYASRRALKILPLYFAVLILYYLFKFIITTPESLLKHFAFLEGSNLFWFMPVQFKYYVIFPIIIIPLAYLAMRRRTILFYPFAALSNFLYYCKFGAMEYPEIFKYADILVYLPVFLLGMAAAVLHFQARQIQFASSKKARILCDLLARVLVILIMATILLKAPIFGFYYTYLALLWGLFIFCLLNGPELTRGIFEITPLRYLGKISFCVYLIHLLIFWLVIKYVAAGMLVNIIVALILTLLIGAAVHEFIELPLGNIRDLKKVCSDFISSFILRFT